MNFTYFVIICVLQFPILCMGQLSEGNNTLSGNVIMPKQKKSILGSKVDYRSALPGLSPAEKAEIDELVHPDYNSFVILHPMNGSAPLPPSKNIVITQRAQTFIPLIEAVTVGSTVYLLNEDNDYHNVYSRTPKASFNIGRRPPGHMYPQLIKKVGIIKVFCDIHEHMKAYVLSLDTPYFVRIDKQGNYRISNLPDGVYQLEVFHLDKQTDLKRVELRGGGMFTENIDLRN